MTPEKFSKLTDRDFENGAVRNEIYIALKRLAALTAQLATLTAEREERNRRLKDADVMISDAEHSLDYYQKAYLAGCVEINRLTTDLAQAQARVEAAERECGELKTIMHLSENHYCSLRRLWARAHAAEIALAEAQKQLRDYEEREAACCPEDVGFEEYISVLSKHELELVAECDATREALREAQRIIVHMNNVFVGHETYYMQTKYLQEARDWLALPLIASL